MSRKVDSDYRDAANMNTEGQKLAVIARRSFDLNIKRKLAENPRTPDVVLFTLAFDNDMDVRLAVAVNPSCPSAIKVLLAKDSSATVRFALAEDPNTPLLTLSIMADSDPNPYVQAQATKTIDAVELEYALTCLDYKVEDGNEFKLGELLYGAGLIEPEEISELVRISEEKEIPLGQTLAKLNRLPKHVITKALILQSQLRRGEINYIAAIEVLEALKLNHQL